MIKKVIVVFCTFFIIMFSTNSFAKVKDCEDFGATIATCYILGYTQKETLQNIKIEIIDENIYDNFLWEKCMIAYNSGYTDIRFKTVENSIATSILLYDVSIEICDENNWY